MNMGGNVVALGGERSYTQSKDMRKKTRIKHGQGQCVMHVWVPAKEGEVVKETGKVLKGNRFSKLAMESGDQQDFTRRV